MELTRVQKQRRKYLEGEIRDCANKMSENLIAMHDEKLYVDTHKTWEDYCRDVWGMTDRHARRLIEHERILSLLGDETGPIGPVLNESHTREVAGLPDDQKREVLEKAIDTAPKDDNGKPKVTATHVRNTVEERTPAPEIPPRNGAVHPADERASIVLDALERPVPSHLLEKQARAAEIMALGRQFDSLRKEVLRLEGEPGGEFIHASEIREGLSKLKGLLVRARYYTECPRCCGKVKAKCKRCDGSGFVAYAAKGHLSSEEQEWLQTA